jgi:hypothetical protein
MEQKHNNESQPNEQRPAPIPPKPMLGEFLNLFTIETEKRIVCIAVKSETITKKQKEHLTMEYGKILSIYNGTSGGQVMQVVSLNFA